SKSNFSIAPERMYGRISRIMTLRLGVLSVTAVLIAALAFGLQRNTNTPQKTSPFNEKRAAVDLQTIVGFGPRPAGSEAIDRAREHIVTALEKGGLQAR